jgi:hypothetical protein
MVKKLEMPVSFVIVLIGGASGREMGRILGWRF